MQKITKKQAMELMKNGWCNIGNVPKKYDVIDIITKKADDIEIVEVRKIDELRSTYFLDDKGVRYDYKGQNYIFETEKRKYIIHDYGFTKAVRILL